MGTVTVLLLVCLAVVLIGVVVYVVLKERYGRGEHRLILYSHKGRELATSSSTNPGSLHRRRNRALRSRRIGSVEIVYANGQREVTFKLHKAEV
jgi:hypothetical protein